ncbi:MAG: IlvD/Edd family dehydratase [Thermaerobacterales bacterium]
MATKSAAGNHTFYGDPGFSDFLRRAFGRHMGFESDDFEKPMIGICDTSSEVNRCHAHLGGIIEAVKRGIVMAGGIPLTFPTISLGEPFTSPTTMMYRNLAAMDTEEMIRSQPLDGVVLLCGCDKVTPSQLMAVASADVPAIMVSGGPMANGKYKGNVLGACTDCRFFWQEHRAGKIDAEELEVINEALAPTAGHCMVMGSASTMAACTEALGMMLPGGAAIPATNHLRLRHAQESGREIVRLVQQQVLPSQIMTYEAFENAIRVAMAIGGSTNAVIHLIAVARRLGIDKVDLDLFDALSRETPFLANLRPAGKYQMEDFFHAGGVPMVMKHLAPFLHREILTVSGQTVGENLAQVKVFEESYEVIRPLADPLYADGGIAVLRGNLAPRGAVIKPHAASDHLLRHKGRAVVFSSIADMEERIDDPDLDIKADDIMVLQNGGPVGAPGMPEAGMLPIPKKLLAEGVRDIVRISDARMSGTAFGTVVLHVSPEAGIGGPLGWVKNGDMIDLDVPGRQLNLLVPEAELAARRAAWSAPANPFTRGFRKLFIEHVQQADDGCDFDFLVDDQGAG